MSLFNLERFRFQRDDGTSSLPKLPKSSDSVSPNSDKENKPASTKQALKSTSKTQVKESRLETWVISDSDGEDAVLIEKPSKGHTSPSKGKKERRAGSDDEDHVDEKKVDELQEIFPNRTRMQLRELIQCTGTLDGAVALCLMQYGDKGVIPPRKRDAASEDEEEKDKDVANPTKKRRTEVPEDSQKLDKSESEEDTDDSGDTEDSFEPSQSKKDGILQRLKKKLPELEEELLRDVLQEHEWHYEDALGSLRMFSDPAEGNSSSKSKSSQPKKASPKSTTPSVSQWMTKFSFYGAPKAAPTKANPGSSNSNSSSHPQPSKPAAKTGKTPSKSKSKFSSSRRGRAKSEDTRRPLSSEDEDEQDDVLSDDYNSEEESRPVSSEQQLEILKFFQEAALHELMLISRCSSKRANIIVSLRPFNTWQDLESQFHRDNGLSPDMLDACRLVLRERQVVQQLMGKCEGISRRMLKDVNALIEQGTGSSKQPAILNSSRKLQSYQLIGLKWLILLHQHKLSGILADEMGLGKTVQAIAFLAHLLEKGITGPHLIVVPASTLDNWVRELQLWCPALQLLVYHGSMEDRRYLRRDILDMQDDLNVILCTYNSPLGNEMDRSLFRKLQLKYAIFDEGHMLKNMNSQRYRYLMAINAEHRLLLTGTPLQNNLLELMSLLNFIMPSMFSSSTSQIAKMFTHKSDEESSYLKDRIDQAKLIMKPFILRRVKTEVLKELPPKTDMVERCSMSPKQKELYTALFSKLKHTPPGERRELCNVMMQLRKMANHPLLHRQYYTTDKLRVMSKAMLSEPTHFDADPVLIQEDMEVMSDFELHNLCLQYPAIRSHQLATDLLLDSGKFHLLTRLLASHKENGDRVVFFSQFVMMLDIVEVLLKHLDHRYIRLDGSTPISDRIGLIDDFNNNPEVFVFLLSTKAGGQGINLTSANVVILHDIDCNPYNDKQAEGRCHRMGQTRPVKVIKIVCKDSIEDNMLRVGQEKLKLEECMTASDTADENSMSEDMAMLLKVSLGL
ncbi:SWI/SNF-related matrix-associated actin-dependent regulator of chromatin subfamily A containing DEAD/H box 1A [Engraulis encrasicolus]|uniref:SWI/SNF-related matrix-associated actin-dependent regulator of chromatin subfamily A containing DEAD/H box 1A n=1 Tax=Engraulis encrasicolus TaxID=184585 RepID=UPI002FCFB507